MTQEHPEIKRLKNLWAQHLVKTVTNCYQWPFEKWLEEVYLPAHLDNAPQIRNLLKELKPA